MQFPDILKKYRANKSLTQKEVAEQLGIPAITVARMEQGINVRLELEPTNLLGDMMQDRSLDMVDGISDIRIWFQYAAELNTSKNLQANVRSCLTKRFMREDVPQKILLDFADMGFERIAGTIQRRYLEDGVSVRYDRRDQTEFDVVLENSKTKKIWALDFYWEFLSPFDYVQLGDSLDDLYKGIGRCCCNGRHIHKYSIITNVSAMVENLESISIVPQNLQYDASVIHYDLSRYQMKTEKSLTSYKNGQGIFDIDVEGKREAATLDYAKWTLMFDKRL